MAWLSSLNQGHTDGFSVGVLLQKSFITTVSDTSLDFLYLSLSASYI